ncbi:MAG: glycerol-3-phosphate 1-O-acyltransferase PlsY [Ruminococcaceae bacterium]|nr:glycerol-3-phosphate 1-O-acyltransferase PlsY [Oscillospiraceae bacterium]
MITFKLIIIAVISYLLGSLNFGVILSKKLEHDDVRKHGSGNAGTTNMLRNYGKLPAILTILGDMAKVALAIYIAFLIVKVEDLSALRLFANNTAIMLKSFAGLFCVLGHIYPCFFGFKGGKGVATSGGMVFMIDWRIALILLALFIITVAVTRYVSLGSILMAVFYPMYTFAFYLSFPLLVMSLIFSVIVVVKHRENIVKLIEHRESKITFSKKEKKE